MQIKKPSGGDPPTDLNAFRKAVKTGTVSLQRTPQGELNALRKPVKTVPDPHSARHNVGRHMASDPDPRPLSHSARHNVGRHMASGPDPAL